MDSFLVPQNFHSIWLSLLSFALIFSFCRIILGPTVADRAVGFDVLTSTCIGFLVVLSSMYESGWMLDAILLLAVLSFLGTVAIVYYMEDTKQA